MGGHEHHGKDGSHDERRRELSHDEPISTGEDRRKGQVRGHGLVAREGARIRPAPLAIDVASAEQRREQHAAEENSCDATLPFTTRCAADHVATPHKNGWRVMRSAPREGSTVSSARLFADRSRIIHHERADAQDQRERHHGDGQEQEPARSDPERCARRPAVREDQRASARRSRAARTPYETPSIRSVPRTRTERVSRRSRRESGPTQRPRARGRRADPWPTLHHRQALRTEGQGLVARVDTQDARVRHAHPFQRSLPDQRVVRKRPGSVGCSVRSSSWKSCRATSSSGSPRSGPLS